MEFVPIALTFLIFAGSLLGFFCSKNKGFGKYTTSLLLLILVLFVGAVAFVTGKIDWPNLGNLLFAIAGYAGGLVTPKDDQG
ncbi:hypothetical protein F2P47_08495 [Parvibaculum sedimenti]|uniref:Holin n=1 Tax=Parvibaculum sedimenti TaxID=2608632 RepID=A0A6N6VP17_9HYPH|nr:hypothetical protein [Parvibaculum sedimenti]KAB7740556.1 hypothetical protein F2P47_08495 [Parvibaculum sedimenti]